MPETTANTPIFQPRLHLIYATNRVPLPKEAILKTRFASVFNTTAESTALNIAQQDGSAFIGEIKSGRHSLHIAGVPLPLPQEVIDHTVMVSPWQAQTKAAMRQHRGQIGLVSAGSDPDPIEQMLALYAAAGAFENEDLLGIININAWTAHPPADFLHPQHIAQYRQEIPFDLWFGHVRFYTDDYHYWLVTKGHHIFDVPDLAAFVGPGDDPTAVNNLFINVFYYLYEQDVFVTAGDTLQISSSGQQLRFTEVTELTEVLMGPSGTLVIEKADPRV
jgi:hypothetical protein